MNYFARYMYSNYTSKTSTSLEAKKYNARLYIFPICWHACTTIAVYGFICDDNHDTDI